MHDKILERIKVYETIIIQRHVRPDPDAYGSQVGLSEIIKASFPDKQVWVVGDADPLLTFLAEMDTIADSVFEQALVIICDAANQPRISDQRYKLAKEIIKIDHHPEVDRYGDIQWVVPTASSTSEMIYELYAAHPELQLTTRGAMLLYAGIVGDTGRFLFPSTSEKTFHFAGELIKYSFDRTVLYEKLYASRLDVARLQGYILQQLKLDETGVCAIRITKDILASYGVTSLETSQLVGTIASIEGVKAWLFFVEEEEQIRVRIRSKGPVINGLAGKYNGGGHAFASGATVYSWDEATKLEQELQDICREFELN
ncbi:DHH family phosphoesterase [Terribacillus saccharophilus]|uniref:DHH family phosphoesterase n=1 Tax=Terribacillus saccharophilus TaxID=361277 RepID=UPI000BA7A8F2|nr:bifunctional oligoribonuclease/PAP phosphatase NrnA [Terribacillus saccharophilus]PAF37682.1 DHH family phosphoesterase [Terribacillus saccharophilus]